MSNALAKERAEELAKFDTDALRTELKVEETSFPGLDERTLLKFTRLANSCRQATKATGMSNGPCAAKAMLIIDALHQSKAVKNSSRKPKSA